MSKILIIDDELAICESMKETLEFEQYEVQYATDPKVGLKIAQESDFDLIISDVKMPGMDGIELVHALRENGVNATICMMSAHGNIETAVKALQEGAFDFLEKPFALDRLFVMVRNALERKALIADNQQLKTDNRDLKRKVSLKNQMIGQSKPIQEVREMIDRVAPTDASVLILGENGTGKEVVARLIHEQSQRNKAPMIEVNCAAIPAELIESELFGHEKGSFTSAIKQRAGKFEQANGGTLFLDEIGDMSLSAQAKVLRALQEREITRIGSDKAIKVDVRIIAATNKNLQKEIEEKNFREDLYHRLNVIPIHVPSLDDRKDDIPLLVNYFVQQISGEQGIAEKTFDNDAIEALKERHWTGNIRELRNMVERLIILAGNPVRRADVQKYA
ncbi:MAG: sigma-54-dependent Fis family transcriptional regulator [Paludibacteraceae bacterium]|nr:sigma-54-dependent Fis family transcriptional regulator [Paludibacteraceae bacterium]